MSTSSFYKTPIRNVTKATSTEAIAGTDDAKYMTPATTRAVVQGLTGSGPITSGNITDFAEAVQDAVAAMLTPGASVTLDYNDETGLLTISSSTGAVTSVNTLTGAVEITKATIGLDQVDNTSDLDKPISTSVANALAAKADVTALSTLATQAYVTDEINSLINGAPGILDTLDDIAQALGDDPNFATTITQQLGWRLRVDTSEQGLAPTQKMNAKINLDLGNVNNTSDAAKPVSTATQTALNGKANTVHSHVIADVTNLQTTLDGKAASSHTHLAANITDFNEAVQDALAATLVAGAGVTLTYNDVGNTLTVAASAVGGVSSVNTRTGAVVLTKTDVGLANVDNTTDLAKPISTATQTALNGKANAVHTHTTADVTGLTAALAAKADTSHTHTTANVTGLDAALAAKAASIHTHAISDVTGLTEALAVAQGNAPDGAKQFEAGITTGAVNFIRVQGALAGDAVSISSQGADTDVDFSYYAKGLAGHHFGNGGGQHFEIKDLGTPTSNWAYVMGGTGDTVPPTFGSPSNLNLEVPLNKFIQFVVNGSVSAAISRHNPTLAVNAYPVLAGSDGSARITTGGPGANRGFLFETAGTGAYTFRQFDGNICIIDKTGAGAPANHPLLRAAPAGSDVQIRSFGETNGSLSLSPTSGGTGTVKVNRANFPNTWSVTGVTYSTPVDGFSTTIGDVSEIYLTPAATLATGTLTMPAAPYDGQTVTISSSQAITALTHLPNTGQTLRGALTTIAANGFATYRYRTANTTWRRIG